MQPNPTPYTYDLPDERIAQRPVYPYDSAKLLHIKTAPDAQHALTDRIFSDLPTLLNSGDLLVLNNSMVKPARFFGHLSTGGAVEVLLTNRRDKNVFEAIARPMRKLNPSTPIQISSELTFIVKERLTEKTILLEAQSSNLEEFFNTHGTMPIPPYIRGGHGDADDKSDYQSQFAEKSVDSLTGGFGSIAAPTASLHFTQSLIEALDAKGIKRAFVTLDVGLASVLPVVQEDGSVRPPGVERVRVPDETIKAIESTRRAGHKVIAVGTTVVRALESHALNPQAASADIFIKPGHVFKMLDWVITNFHQPASSHLLLIEALIGAERLQNAYEHALHSNYRFLSYGDAMLISR